MAEEKLAYLTARLKLDYSDLEKAGGQVKNLGNEMKAAADKGAKPLEESVKKVGLSGADIKKVGRDLTVGVTLPLVAAGAASIKLAGDFDTTFGQMVGLAGVATDEVDGLKSAVLGLAGQTAQAPNDLAQALYFIRSAGIDGADAMGALEASAKGAASGLGDAASVADAITSAMNAYGPANLSAAAATDVLVASVREGKAEASAFAPQLGRLLPLAKSLGVGFDQVAGTLAFLSRTSGDAAQSATQVQGIMQALIAPTGDAAKALEGVGLSGEQVRRVIQEKGLLAALRLLDQRFSGNSEQLRKVFGDIQGFTGALALVKAPAREVDEVLAAVADSAGATDAAFQATSETGAFKMRKAMADVQVALVQVGQVLLPIAADVASFGAAVVGAFDKLPGPVKTATVGLLGVVAAAGPVISIGSRIKDAFGIAEKAIASMSASTGRLSSVMAAAGPVALGLTAAVAAFAIVLAPQGDIIDENIQLLDRYAQAMEGMDASFESSANVVRKQILLSRDGAEAAAQLGVTYEELRGVLDGTTNDQLTYIASLQQAAKGNEVAEKAVERLQFALGDLRFAEATRAAVQMNQALATLGRDGVAELVKQSDLSTHAQVVLLKAMRDGKVEANELGDSVSVLNPLLDELKKASGDAAGGVDDAADAAKATAKAAEPAAYQVRNLATELDDAKQSADSFRGALDLLTGGALDLEDAAIQWEGALADVSQALKDNGSSLDITTEKGRANRETIAGAAKAALDHAAAMVATGASADEAKAAVVQHTLALLAQLKQFGLTDAQAVEYLKTLGLTPENIDTAIRLSGDADAKRRVQELLDRYRNIPEEKRTEIQAAIDAGQYAYAESLLAQLAQPRTVRYRVQVDADALRRLPGGTNRGALTGGPVMGAPDSPQPMLLHGGEFVLSRDVVDAIKRGGQTLGLGRKALAVTGGGGTATTAVTETHKHYHLAVTTPPLIDGAAVVSEQFARMEALHG